MTDNTTRPVLKYRRPPAPEVDSDAERFARDWIAVRRHGDLFELGLAPLHPDAGHSFFRRMLKHFAVHDEKSMMIVLDIAYAGINDAREALVELILEYGNAGLAPPALLAEFNPRMLTGKMSPILRGHSKAGNVLQDLAAAVLVDELVERFGLSPTRRRWTHSESAIDIVTAELRKAGIRGCSGYHLAKVWSRYGPLMGFFRNQQK
jgi:hypothetical protein